MNEWNGMEMFKSDRSIDGACEEQPNTEDFTLRRRATPTLIS